jgi:hypothetical protein
MKTTCYHPTDDGRTCGFCLPCQARTTPWTSEDIEIWFARKAAKAGNLGMAARDDWRDAALMLELAQGTRELGARATLCPIMLASIGLDWEAVKAIARSMVGTYAATRALVSERARLDAVQNAGQNGRAWEC